MFGKQKMKSGLLELLLFEALLWNISIQLDNMTVNITAMQLNYVCIKNEINLKYEYVWGSYKICHRT